MTHKLKKKLFVTGCKKMYKNISSISQAFTIVFNLKTSVNVKNQMKSTHPDEIHAPFQCYLHKTRMFVLDVHWKIGKTQKEILKPDKSLMY